jgi:hypothetical protein
MNALAPTSSAYPYARLIQSAAAVVPTDLTLQRYSEEGIAPTASAWAHLAERLIDAAIHANFAGALVLITLTSLGVSLCALWTVQLAIPALRDRTPKH